jgi:type VI secretion system secreted protein VgrG
MQYRYHDDEPIQGARYKATLSDGTIREGTLDDAGALKLDDVPVGTINVELGPDSRSYRRKDDTHNVRFTSGQLTEGDLDSLIGQHGGA